MPRQLAGRQDSTKQESKPGNPPKCQFQMCICILPSVSFLNPEGIKLDSQAAPESTSETTVLLLKNWTVFWSKNFVLGYPKLKVLRRLVGAKETRSQSFTPSILHFQSNHRAVSVNIHRVCAESQSRNKAGRESHLLCDQQCLLSGRFGL